MPIYEYTCNQCGTLFDAIRSFREADFPIPCKKCHSQETHRKISSFFAHSAGKQISGGQSKSCGGCHGGSCGGCHH